MKTSLSLLMLSALLIGLKAVKPELTGVLLLDSYGEPKNNIVRFWMEKFDYKNTPDTLTVNFKHLKLAGGEKINLEIQPQDSAQTVYFLIPSNQTFEMANDTLIIHSQSSLRAGSYIKVKGNVESIDVTGGTTLLINQVRQNFLHINVKDRSNLQLISNVWTGEVLIKNGMPALENLRIKATGESNVELRNLATTHVSVDVNNSMLKYWSNLTADTLQVNLGGKSNVKMMDQALQNGVNTLIVSGNKTYFKPDLAGKELVVE